MSELISEFTFILETPVSIAVGGSFVPVSEMILKAPSNKQRNESAKLKQGFFRAVEEMQGRSSDKIESKETINTSSDDDLTGDKIIPVLFMSKIDINAYQENFRVLLLNDICTIGGTKLTSPIFDSISDADTERLMGEYIANFLLSSLKRINGNK